MPDQAYIAGIPLSGVDSLARWTAASAFGGPAPIPDADLFCSEAATRSFAGRNPDARILLCLRDPVELAWSLHAVAAKSRTVSMSDFEAAWPGYRDLVRQGARLALLLSMVDRKQLHLVVHGDLSRNPEAVRDGIYRFLSCENEATRGNPRLEAIEACVKNSRSAMTPRPSPLARLALLARQARARIPGPGRAPAPPRPIRAIPPDIRERVAADLSEDVALISVFADRDLSHWL